MSNLTIYRGTHQIGGCCTEITCGGERILIDLGANLPDCDSPIQDDELVSKVFDGRPTAGLLFTHPHGDHYGLYKKVPKGVPMYIGPIRDKDACLETVRKLVRLCYEIRRNGVLVADTLAEQEEDPFFRACLLELEFEEGYIKPEDEPARLDRVLAAYLAAGDYRGGAFLNAVVAAKGTVLLCRHLNASPIVQGELLSVELRGFFGAEYREHVITTIKREIRCHARRRKTSVVPAFDELAHLPVEQRRQLLQDVESYTLSMALRGAGAATEDALMEALGDREREIQEREWEYDPYYDPQLSLFAKEIEHAQEEILARKEP